MASSQIHVATLNKPSGLVGVIEALGGFGIGMTEYMALLIIDSLSKTFGIDTKGKSLKDILLMFNTVLDDPEVRDALILIMRSLSQVLLIFIDELKAPLKELVQESIDLGASSVQKFAKSLISESIDVLGVVPGVGEVVEGVKLLDDVIKQMQASIGVILKTGVLLTSFLESGLGSFTTIKESIDNAVNTINSAFNSIPTMENMERAAKERAANYLNNKIETVQNQVQNKVQNAVKDVVQSAIPTITSKKLLQQQTGGMKLLKKNNMDTSNRIRKTIKIFLDRNNNNNKKSSHSTRRRKQF
jgi:hypothetical protein